MVDIYFIFILVVLIKIAYIKIRLSNDNFTNMKSLFGANMMKKNPFQRVQATPIENFEIREKGLDPQDFTTVECLCLGMQIVNSVTVKNNVTGENDPMLAVVVQVAIPIDPKSMTNALITPDGLTNKFTEACPVAPTVRVAIHNDYIVESFRGNDEEPSENSGDPKDLDNLLKDLGI